VCIFSEQLKWPLVQRHASSNSNLTATTGLTSTSAAAGTQGLMSHAGPGGINTPSQNVAQGQPQAGSAGVNAGPYPSFSVQRRAQLAQQGLGGMGGRKTGLSFDVILSHLQGESQKSINERDVNWIP
jgi:hypothetical protein